MSKTDADVAATFPALVAVLREALRAIRLERNLTPTWDALGAEMTRLVGLYGQDNAERLCEAAKRALTGSGGRVRL